MNKSSRTFNTLFISPPLSQEETKFFQFFLDKVHSENESILNKGLYNTEVTPSDMPISIGEMTQKMVDWLYTNTRQFADKSQQTTFPSASCPLSLKEKDGVCQIVVEKFTKSSEVANWISFIYEHFFKEDCIAKQLYPGKYEFLKQHTFEGTYWKKEIYPYHAKKIEFVNQTVKLSTSATQSAEENNILWADVEIKYIAEKNDIASMEIINFPKSSLLNKMIMAAKLENNISHKNTPSKKLKI